MDCVLPSVIINILPCSRKGSPEEAGLLFRRGSLIGSAEPTIAKYYGGQR